LGSKEKKIYLIKNEMDETVGTFFSISEEKLQEYIDTNNLYPKTDITIKEFQNIDDEADVVPLVCTERFLWYELKHRRSVHVVK